MAKKQKGWFKIETATDLYYTHKNATKKTYATVGDGSRIPTPKEMKDAMEANPDGYIDESTYLMTEYDVTDTKKQPINLPAGCYQHAQASSMASRLNA